MSGQRELVQGALSALPEQTRVSKCSQQLCPLRLLPCRAWPALPPVPANLFPSLDPSRSPAGAGRRDAARTDPTPKPSRFKAGTRGSQLEIRPPACGQRVSEPGVPSRPRRSGLRGSARALSPALPEQGVPRLSRCSGPGATNAGPCPSALPKVNLAAGPLPCAHRAHQGADRSAFREN